MIIWKPVRAGLQDDGKRLTLAEATARALNAHKNANKLNQSAIIVGVLPTMLAYYADCPQRYEVTEAVVLLEDGR